MTSYIPRTIRFKELIKVDDWTVKTYIISKDGNFSANKTYDCAVSRLSHWLNQENSFDTSNNKLAFLIIYSITEGIFTVLNWWVGKNMLNTQIHISNNQIPEEFKLISRDNLSPWKW